MPRESDSRQQIAEFFELSTGSSQSTITRQEPVRVREALIQGTLDSAATTRVFASGTQNPVLLSYTAQVETATTDNWEGQDYRAASSAANSWRVHWDGPSHPTASVRNSFLFQDIGANRQGQRYRIWFRWIEREP